MSNNQHDFSKILAKKLKEQKKKEEEEHDPYKTKNNYLNAKVYDI